MLELLIVLLIAEALLCFLKGMEERQKEIGS
jgi:hypothetical protein